MPLTRMRPQSQSIHEIERPKIQKHANIAQDRTAQNYKARHRAVPHPF